MIISCTSQHSAATFWRPAVIHFFCRSLFTRPLGLVCSHVIDLSEGHYTIWMCVRAVEEDCGDFFLPSSLGVRVTPLMCDRRVGQVTTVKADLLKGQEHQSRT